MNQKQKIQQRALKAGAAAEYLGISRRGITDLARQGRIPYAKISNRLTCYDIADLNAFLDSCKIGGEA
jgi:excisionase family DNA binding protein